MSEYVFDISALLTFIENEEFEQIEDEIKQLKLPYKKKVNK